MFKGLSNLAGMLKQAQQIGGQMDKLTEQLKTRRVTGAAGGGMVEVEINGLLEVVRCRIDPQLFGQGDRELIEDWSPRPSTAVAKGKQLHADALKELTGGLPLPGIQEALEKLAGPPDDEPQGE